MELFDGRYFIVNKKILKVFGLWFEQEPVEKRFRQICIISMIFFASIPQVYALQYSFGGKIYRIIIHITSVMYFNEILIKIITTILAESKFRAVFQTISENFCNIKDVREREILLQYSERGRNLTILYITYMSSACCSFVTVPLVPILFDKIHPQNQSVVYMDIFFGKYPFDHDENYFYIYTFELIICVASVVVFSAIDSTYAACINHCLGLFAIIKFRLITFTNNIKDNHAFDELSEKDFSYARITETIKLHKKILDFADNLESSYSTGFLLLLIANGLHSTLLCTVIIEPRIDFMNRGRFISILIGLLIHLLFLSWPGQELIDYSTGIFDDAFRNEWYKCSIKTRNLLRLISLRSLKPCQLTAGGICIFNFTNFASVLKTSASYITLFSSLD